MVRSSQASRDPQALAREFTSITDAQLKSHLREGIPGEPGALLGALRDEASQHYHANAAEARRIARRALIIARALDDPLAIGWAYRTQAEALLFSGRIGEAERAYAHANDAWITAGADALRGQLLVARTHVLALLGHMDAVTPTAREAATLLEAAGDRIYQAKLAMNMGSIHFQRDEYAEALAAYERADQLFRKLRLRDETVVGLDVNRAVALTQLDRDAEALALFGRLARDCHRRGFEVLEAQVWMNAGYVHSLRGDFDVALRLLTQATQYFQRTDHPAFLGNCLINHAEIYQQLNLFGEALEMCTSATAHFQTAGLPYDRALALSQSALTHLAAGDPIAALKAVRIATKLFQKEENPARVALMTYLGAEALARRGRHAQARRQAQVAFEAFKHLRLIRWEASAGALWWRLQTSANPQVRRAQLQRLLRRVPARIYPLQALALLELLGEAHEQVGSSRGAVRSFSRAVELLESLHVRVPTEDSKIAFLRDKTHLYDRLLRIELGRPRARAPQLFHWMERARAQTLWDRLRDPARWSARGARGASAAQRRRLSWLHARASRLELGTAEERERAWKMRGELLEAEHAFERDLRRRGEAETRPRARTHAQGHPGDLNDLARLLPQGYGFLSYHLGADFAVAAGTTSAGPFWLRLNPDISKQAARLADRLDFQWSAAALDSVHRRATHATGGPPTQRLQAATDDILAQLYNLLWLPLEDLGLPKDVHWIVSPHGALHRIPLHALRGPNGYLADQTTIQLTPSARIWHEVTRRRRTRPKRAYLAALPSPELPAVEREIDLVRARLRGWQTRIDLAPTRERLAREAAKAGIIHIAAHGELRTDNPAFSCIHLADGPLFVHDLATLRLSGAVVVLTACSSGRAGAPAGDELIGLARGFLQAGASQIIASLWPIEDDATCDLIESFYAALAEKVEPEMALQQAMMASRVTRPHPWYWASLAVLGGRAAPLSQ